MVYKNRIADLSAEIVPQGQQAHQAQQAQGGRTPFFHIIWRRRWWILLSMVLSLVTSYCYLSKQTPIFSSSTRLYVQDNGHKVLGGIGDEDPLSAQYDLIKSMQFLANVAKRPEVANLAIMRWTDNPAALIRSMLSVAGNGDSLTISCESPDAVAAAQVANSVAESFEGFIAQNRSTTSGEVLKVLQTERREQGKELKRLRDQTLSFKREHGVLSFQDEKGNILLQRLARLSELLTTAQLDTIDAKGNAEAVKALLADPNSGRTKLLDLARAQLGKDSSPVIHLDRDGAMSVADENLDSTIAALRNQVDDAEFQILILKQTHTSAHPDVRKAEAQLVLLKERVKKKITERKMELAGYRDRLVANRSAEKDQDTRADDQKLIDSFLALVERRLSGAIERESQLNKVFETQKTLAFDLNSIATEYESLASELRRVERLCDMLDDRIKDVNIHENTALLNVSILDVAGPATTPIRPDARRILAMGLVVGLMLGLGLAFGTDMLDQRIRSVEEVAALVGAPVLGLIPHMEVGITQIERGRAVSLNPSSEIAEAYRTIRTAVFFAARESAAKTLLVTSASASDGKTTSASNLAISMAQAGQRILLIDADCRRPVQHKIFELKDRIGLTSVMSGAESLESAIHSTGIENLDLLPCGKVPTNPSELLNGQVFADLLQRLGTKYDHIILDSPPIAPITDGRILAALCDETILVLRAERSTRRATEHARNTLASVGARLIGIVVNDVPRRRDRYGYYYGYSYGYRYYQYSYKVGDPKTNQKGNNGHGKLLDVPSTNEITKTES